MKTGITSLIGGVIVGLLGYFAGYNQQTPSQNQKTSPIVYEERRLAYSPEEFKNIEEKLTELYKDVQKIKTFEEATEGDLEVIMKRTGSAHDSLSGQINTLYSKIASDIRELESRLNEDKKR